VIVDNIGDILAIVTSVVAVPGRSTITERWLLRCGFGQDEVGKTTLLLVVAIRDMQERGTQLRNG
jgi:hypothetical protein